MVVAFPNGERLVKYVFRHGGRVALIKVNYPAIDARQRAELVIWGIGNYGSAGLPDQGLRWPSSRSWTHNNFYARLRLFDPTLAGKPIVDPVRTTWVCCQPLGESKALACRWAPLVPTSRDGAGHGISLLQQLCAVCGHERSGWCVSPDFTQAMKSTASTSFLNLDGLTAPPAEIG